MRQEEYRSSGNSLWDPELSLTELEGSIDSFGDGDSLRKPMVGYVAGEGGEAPPEEHEGPAGFIDFEGKSTGDRQSPEVHKEDPQFLR
jgi:hypothetical protein